MSLVLPNFPIPDLTCLNAICATGSVLPTLHQVQECLNHTDSEKFCFVTHRLSLPDVYSKSSTDFEKTSLKSHWPTPSLGLSACLPRACDAENIETIFDSLCAVPSCSLVPDQFPCLKQACPFVQPIHCDPRNRLRPNTNSPQVSLYCAWNKIQAPKDAGQLADNLGVDEELSDSPINTQDVILSANEMEALTACGTESLKSLMSTWMNSGGPQNLGNYDSCVGAGNNYCTIRYFDAITAGHCGPPSCTEAKLESLIRFICSKLQLPVGQQSPSCLDFVGVIPLDFCLATQTLACSNASMMLGGNGADLVEMASNLLDSLSREPLLKPFMQSPRLSEQIVKNLKSLRDWKLEMSAAAPEGSKGRDDVKHGGNKVAYGGNYVKYGEDGMEEDGGESDGMSSDGMFSDVLRDMGGVLEAEGETASKVEYEGAALRAVARASVEPHLERLDSEDMADLEAGDKRLGEGEMAVGEMARETRFGEKDVARWMELRCGNWSGVLSEVYSVWTSVESAWEGVWSESRELMGESCVLWREELESERGLWASLLAEERWGVSRVWGWWQAKAEAERVAVRGRVEDLKHTVEEDLAQVTALLDTVGNQTHTHFARVRHLLATQLTQLFEEINQDLQRLARELFGGAAAAGGAESGGPPRRALGGDGARGEGGRLFHEDRFGDADPGAPAGPQRHGDAAGDAAGDGSLAGDGSGDGSSPGDGSRAGPTPAPAGASRASTGAVPRPGAWAELREDLARLSREVASDLKVAGAFLAHETSELSREKFEAWLRLLASLQKDRDLLRAKILRDLQLTLSENRQILTTLQTDFLRPQQARLKLFRAQVKQLLQQTFQQQTLLLQQHLHKAGDLLRTQAAQIKRALHQILKDILPPPPTGPPTRLPTRHPLTSLPTHPPPFIAADKRRRLSHSPKTQPGDGPLADTRLGDGPLADTRLAKTLLADAKNSLASYSLNCSVNSRDGGSMDKSVVGALLAATFILLPAAGVLKSRNSHFSTKNARDRMLETTTTTGTSSDGQPTDGRSTSGDGYTDVEGDRNTLTKNFSEDRQRPTRTSDRKFASLLSCFDPIQNLTSLEALKQKTNTEFSHLAGLRVISMLWVVLGHSFTFAFTDGVISNLDRTAEILGSATFQIVASGQLAVDTFFFFSGFLLARFGVPKYLAMCQSLTMEPLSQPCPESQSHARVHQQIARHPAPQVGANSCLGSPVSKVGSPSFRAHTPPAHTLPADAHPRALESSVIPLAAEDRTGLCHAKASLSRTVLGICTLMGTWMSIIVRRYLRLAPLLYFVMAVSYFGLERLGDGPLWPLMVRFTRTGQTGGCKRWWWANALFVNNLLPPESVFDCVGHSWYLANDLQFFMVGLALLLLGCYESCRWKRPYASCAVGVSVLLGSYVTIAISCIKYNFHFSMVQSSATLALDARDPGLQHQAIGRIGVSYVRPWNRIPPFLIGLAYGVLYANGMFQRFITIPRTNTQESERGRVALLSPSSASSLKDKTGEEFDRLGVEVPPKRVIDRPMLLMLQIIALVLMAGMLVPIPYQANRPNAPVWNRVVEIIYISTYRSVWALCIGWMVCTIASQEPINQRIKKMLSNEVFAFLAVLSYGTYLVHPYVQSIFYAEGRHSITLREGDQWFDTLWHGIMATAVAFSLWLFVERPFARLVSCRG